MVYGHKQFFRSLGVLFFLFPKVFNFSFEYIPLCSAPSEDTHCSFKSFHKTFVEFTNLKVIWYSKKSGFLYWICSPSAIKNSKGLIWDHRGLKKKKTNKPRTATKPVFCFSNPTDYVCLFFWYFFKFRKTRLGEDNCRAQSCATTVLWTLHCLKSVIPLIFVFIGCVCISWSPKVY